MKTLERLLSELEVEIRTINEANGWTPLEAEDWNDQHRVPASIALLHSEVSEMLEAWRVGDAQNFAEECADVFIRLLNLTAPFHVYLADEVNKKLAKNRQRGERHGGKRL